jgi:anti-sigma regulatory factor (Ser/Thr protein kinase)
VNQAQQRLDAALDEQARLSERLERSIGTSAEFSAYSRLRAARLAIADCEAHDEESGAPSRDACRRFVFSLLRDSTAPGVARAEIERRLGGLVDGEALTTTVLLASETVTNAVRHGGVGVDDTVDVEADLSADRLWVGITNAGPECQHVPSRPADLSPGGRGLFLVEELSRAWGTGHAHGSTSVWFEVERAAV